MSAVRHVIKQIRALSYPDMMAVTGEIRDRLSELANARVEADVLAQILCRLNEGRLSSSEETLEEEKVLREIFRVKRAMSIQRTGNGWTVEVNNVPGSQAVAPELRQALSMMLDQIITLHVLTKK